MNGYDGDRFTRFRMTAWRGQGGVVGARAPLEVLAALVAVCELQSALPWPLLVGTVVARPSLFSIALLRDK